MKYLLDTDVLSNLIRPRPSPSLLRRLAATPVAEQATSSINLGELYFGARRLDVGGEELIAKIESALLPNLTVLTFDALVALQYAHIRARLERAGTPIGEADTRIAAVAMTNGLTVVTGNVRHFERVEGLPVENWLS